jgi:hypothetical protein
MVDIANTGVNWLLALNIFTYRGKDSLLRNRRSLSDWQENDALCWML